MRNGTEAAVGRWPLPVAPAALRCVGLPDTLLADTLLLRVGAGSLPIPGGAPSVILSVHLFISPVFISLASIAASAMVNVVSVMADAASVLTTGASGVAFGIASAVAGGVDIRGGTRAITIRSGGGILVRPTTRTTTNS